MKRITTLACLAIGVSAFAQPKIITGTVIEPKGGAITIAPKYIKPLLDSNNTYITSDNFDVVDRKGNKKYVVSSPIKQVPAIDNTPVTTGFTTVTLNGINGAVLLTPTKKSDFPAQVKPVNTQPVQQQSQPVQQQTQEGKFLNLIDNKGQNQPVPPPPSKEIIDPNASQSDEVPSLLTPVIKPVNVPQGLRANTESIDPNLLQTLPNKKPSSLDLTGTGAKGYTMPALETIDPAFLQPKNNATTSTLNNSKTTVMPELVAIEAGAKPSGNSSYNRSGMPELAPIEGGYKPASQNGMPELSPIEGVNNATNNYQKTMPELAAIEGASGQNQNISMPALAAIDGQQNYNQQQLNYIQQQPAKTNFNPNVQRGFVLPKGTLLSAQDRITYVVKPIAPQPAPKTTTQNQEMVYHNYKPGAGGGMLMPELAPIEPMANTITGSTMPALAPIEGDIEKKELMPALALIEQQTVATQYYNAQQPAPKLAPANPGANYNQQYNRPVATTQPCNCPVPKKKKWYLPKKKPVYRAPVLQEIKYVEKPSQTIVYVPVQQQQQTNPPTPPKQEVVFQPPPVQQQTTDNFTYRDYTNTYKKEEPKQNCNCGQQQTQPKQSIFVKSQDPSTYYDPSKYSGVSAGPTSGDYPVNPTNFGADQGMRYTFYVNKKGDYSVAVFNNLANVLVSQDGKVLEYKINQAQDQFNTPKTNYFGSVDNIAGIPITYNYNRSVNRIGNIDFTYDFEGFIKTIGGNTVLYNNRSRLSQVGNVHVSYNGNTVSSVTPNNGLVYFTNN